ncbi:MAG: uroporphyrinogen-III synthase [Pseudomonadota bacterium]
MTRPRAAAMRFVRSLPGDVQLAVHPVYSPLIEIVGLAPDVTFGPGDTAIFTSANGVENSVARPGHRAYCVGHATMGAALNRGWHAIQTGVDADDMVRRLLHMRPDQRLIHLSGTHTRGNVVARLRDAGLRAERVAVYDQRLLPLTADAQAIIAKGGPVLAPIFSPRTAQQFAKTLQRPTCVHVIAMSLAVAEPLVDIGLAGVYVAAAPDARSMGAELSAVLARL